MHYFCLPVSHFSLILIALTIKLKQFTKRPAGQIVKYKLNNKKNLDEQNLYL